MKFLIILLIATMPLAGCIKAKPIPDGEKIVYYVKGGPIRAKHTYKNGMKNGPSVTYYKSGVIRSTSTYKNDQLEGIVKRYDPRGQLAGEAKFKNGVQVSEKRYKE